jgi:hypothetical protein
MISIDCKNDHLTNLRVVILLLLEYISVRINNEKYIEKQLLIIRDYLSSATKMRLLLPILIRWLSETSCGENVYDENVFRSNA